MDFTAVWEVLTGASQNLRCRFLVSLQANFNQSLQKIGLKEFSLPKGKPVDDPSQAVDSLVRWLN